MRIFSLRALALFALLAAHAGCDPCNKDLPPGSIGACGNISLEAGTEGAACKEGDVCDTGLECISHSQCMHTGNENEPCNGAHFSTSDGTCNNPDALTCAWDGGQDWFTCQSCGHDNDGCCINNIGHKFCVNGNECTTDDSDGCAHGDGNGNGNGGGPSASCGDANDPVYFVYAINGDCGSQQIPFHAANDAAAQKCVDEVLKPGSVGWTFGAPSQIDGATKPKEWQVCPTGCNEFGTSGETKYFYAFDEAQLHQCETNYDATCTMWSNTACP